MDTRSFEEQKIAIIEKQSFLEDFVLPDYDAFNIMNIKSLVGRVFEINSLGSSVMPNDTLDDFNGVQKVFFIIMDGFGYNRLMAYIKQNSGFFSELIMKGILKPLTSAFPATTSTSLTSIFTGLKPSEHGIIGYLMFSREYGCIYNTLDMKPVYGHGADIEIAKGLSRKVKPWMPTLQANGVNTLILTRGAIIGSGLSRVTYAETSVTPYVLESEMFIKARKALEQKGPTFVALYFSGIDTLEHKYGPYSEEVTSVIQLFEFLLKTFVSRLSEDVRKETLLILTSDHGVCETKNTLYLKDYPEIVARLQLPPVGDSRATFLSAKQEERENLKSSLEKNLPRFRLVEARELINSGAFGKTSDSRQLQSAIGDYAELSKCLDAISYPYHEEDRNREQRGGHGGMSQEEVIVPLLSLRLSKL